MPMTKVHGWLVIDKPLNITSARVVSAVKRLFSGQKVGHAGTLDPLATGVLPLAIGEATKLMSYAVDGSKTYDFTVQWGEERTTDDCEGDVSNTSDVHPTLAEIQEILPQFTGDILQQPPGYSAIKVNGERAYDLMRRGEDVQLPARPVFVKSLTLENHSKEETAFKMQCGKGTYVRSIARDLGRMLKCYGHVTVLRRTQVGAFVAEKAIPLQKLLELEGHSELRRNIKRFDEVLDDIPAATLTDEQISDMRLGRRVLWPCQNPDDPSLIWACKNADGLTIALASCSSGFLQPKRVFNL